MSLRPLLSGFTDVPDGAALARDGGRAFVSSSLRPYVLAALADEDRARPTLVVAGDDRQARDLAGDLRAWLHPRPVRFYPSRGVAYESHLTPPPHLVGLRVAALDALLDPPDAGQGEAPVVVVSAVALSEKVPDPALRPHAFHLRVGELLDLDDCMRDLVAAGYERVDQVDDRGQFAARGGLLDIYPATEDRAVRVDLFDIEIESLRWFSTFTQRSLGETTEVEIAPAAELAMEHRELAEIAALDYTGKGTISERPVERPDISELLPVDRFAAFLDLTPDAAILIAAEEELGPALADHWQDVCAAFHDDDAHHLYVAPDAITAALDERAVARLSSHDAGQPLEFRAQAPDLAARSLREAEPELEKLVRSGYRTVVAWPQRGEGDRARYNLGRLKASWLGEGDGQAGRVIETPLRFAHVRLRDGFIAAGLKLAILPEHRLFRRRRQERTGGRDHAARRRGALRSFADLRTGDIVVHEDHGIARFAGFETKTVAGVTRDYLYLEYHGDDRVFVPSEQLAKISRYVGAGGSHPPLSRLGGKSWELMKTRARRAAQELAGELLNLYAERRRRTGLAFPPDSDWLREFEAAFSYTETADQREAIELVKVDMESERPMDRLICGDVGFGKTEVALRAAFVAAMAGHQVALIGPTTLLARQHYKNFVDRFHGFPIEIGRLSRLVPAAEAKRTRERLEQGQVDIVIGTHALLAKSINFKKLGLVIVDEEQHFGVAHKERLKALRADVHVLTLTATPIPRTLQMAMSGLRELSVIQTPPVDRLAVRTYVTPWDPIVVREALLREHYRGGQSFVVVPRIADLADMEEWLREEVSEVKAVTAHGQMAAGQVEERMSAFYDRNYDVLLSTTIIESGLDIPSANTLIVHRADRFGLAQLYQLRGRVGRSKTRAYAYLTTAPDRQMTESAQKRLQVLANLDSLGAGFQLASHDLDIRGAGNLLGDEQSGHIKEVGFELYQAMLEEEILEQKSGVGERREEYAPQINVEAPILIPELYVPDLDLRMGLYRRLGDLESRQEVDEFAAEMIDRFGKLPEETRNLLTIVETKINCRAACIAKLDVGAKGAVVTFIDRGFPDLAGLLGYVDRLKGQARLRPDSKLIVSRDWGTGEARLNGALQISRGLARVVAAGAVAAA